MIYETCKAAFKKLLLQNGVHAPAFFKPPSVINWLLGLRASTPWRLLWRFQGSRGRRQVAWLMSPLHLKVWGKPGVGSTLTHPGKRIPGRQECLPGRLTCPPTLWPQQLWGVTCSSGSKLLRKDWLSPLHRAMRAVWGGGWQFVPRNLLYTPCFHIFQVIFDIFEEKCPKELN